MRRVDQPVDHGARAGAAGHAGQLVDAVVGLGRLHPGSQARDIARQFFQIALGLGNPRDQLFEQHRDGPRVGAQIIAAMRIGQRGHLIRKIAGDRPRVGGQRLQRLGLFAQVALHLQPAQAEIGDLMLADQRHQFADIIFGQAHAAIGSPCDLSAKRTIGMKDRLQGQRIAGRGPGR